MCPFVNINCLDTISGNGCSGPKRIAKFLLESAVTSVRCIPVEFQQMPCGNRAIYCKGLPIRENFVVSRPMDALNKTFVILE